MKLQCPKCNTFNEGKPDNCKGCGCQFVYDETIQPAPSETTITFNPQQVLGIAGAVILFIGAFCPLITAPIIGSISYVHNGTGDGIFVIILAVISLVLAIVKKYKWLLFTGSAALLLVGFTFINFRMRMSEAQEKMDQDLADNMFKGLSDVFMNSVQLSWGWAILIIGVSCLIASGIWGFRYKTRNANDYNSTSFGI